MSTQPYAYDESAMLAGIRAWKAETMPPLEPLTFAERPYKTAGISLPPITLPEEPNVRRKPPIRPAKLVSLASAYFKCSEDALKSHFNSPIAVTRRQVCWLILKQKGYSMPIIGNSFTHAGRPYHHTTVMYGVNRAKDRMHEPDFRAAYDALVEMAG